MCHKRHYRHNFKKGFDVYEKQNTWNQRKSNAGGERKTFEKLKEKAFEEFKLEIEAQEKKEVDELTSFRFGSARESEEI